jgi:outer membrane protein TolC
LGGLCHWCKITTLLFVFLNPCVLLAQGSVISSYQDFLKTSLTKSPEYQKIKFQLNADNLSAEGLLSVYNWTLSGGVTQTDAERPQTNPFSPNQQKSNLYNLRLSKETASGLSPYLELNGVDQSLSFPNSTTVEFQTASLELGFRLNIIKALVNKGGVNAFKEASTRKEIAVLAHKNAKAHFIKSVSKAFFTALKSFKRLRILDTQCSEYSKLQKISSQRFKKRLTREKDYLTIEVLYQNCLLDKRTAQNNFEIDNLNLFKVAGLSSSFKIDFKKIEFVVLPIQKQKFIVSSNVNYQITKKMLEALEQKTASEKSKLFPDFNFTYGLRSEALDEGVLSSFAKATKFDLLTHNLGLELRYQFGKSFEKLDVEQKKAQMKVRSLELENLKNSLDRDFNGLFKRVVHLKDALSKSRNLVNLQSRKASLFRKDFKNGKGSIRDLVEAQIAYLSSLEKSLSFQQVLANSQLDLAYIEGRSFDQID